MTSVRMRPVPTLVNFQYKAKIPSSWQWQAGIQKALPWGIVGDVTYVGNHGFNRLGSFQGGTRQLLNAVDRQGPGDLAKLIGAGASWVVE